MLEIIKFEDFGKDGGTKHPDDPFNKFLKMFDMGSISSREHEIAFFEILNKGSISLKTYEMDIS